MINGEGEGMRVRWEVGCRGWAGERYLTHSPTSPQPKTHIGDRFWTLVDGWRAVLKYYMGTTMLNQENAVRRCPTSYAASVALNLSLYSFYTCISTQKRGQVCTRGQERRGWPAQGVEPIWDTYTYIGLGEQLGMEGCVFAGAGMLMGLCRPPSVGLFSCGVPTGLWG